MSKIQSVEPKISKLGNSWLKNFAVNGAVHYANAILHYTNYTEIFAIGMTGYKDEKNNLQHKIAVYYVSKKKIMELVKKSENLQIFLSSKKKIFQNLLMKM